MPQIHLLTPAQEALIPEYQEKWRRIYLSIQPIERIRAEAAVKGAYAVMGKQKPEVIFCTSPRAALEFLQTYISPIDVPQDNVRSSSQQIQSNFLSLFLRAIWDGIKLRNKQQQAGTKPLHDLLQEVSSESHKFLGKHIDRCLPKDLSTQDIVEQSFLSSSPLFDNLGKHMDRRGEPELSRTLQDRPIEDWQESFRATASAVETQLAWLPAKGFLFRGWLKQMLQSTLVAKVSGVEPPRLQDTISAALSFSVSEHKFLLENPLVSISDYAFCCTWIDFASSALNCSLTSRKWSALRGLIQDCGWIFAVNNLCIICDRPTRILLDDDYQPHGEGEPAIHFADGFVAYAHHGTPLPGKYGTVHPKRWQAQWVLEERDQELQSVLVQAIGAARLCQELPTVELDTLQEYTLLKLENVGVKDTHILRRIDSETGNIQAVFVPWHIASVQSATQYVNQNCSTKDFPIPGNEEVE